MVINIGILFQSLIGYNLVFPALLYLFWILRRREESNQTQIQSSDYGIIVTAYQYTDSISDVVNSILKLNYDNYLIYVVADNCDVTNLNFTDDRVILLKPELTLASNTASHLYAMEHFKRVHDYVTIIDSDNLVDPEYLYHLNQSFSKGFEAVQGLRAAKNLDGTIAALDAARDLYYHFYDGKLLFESGSSATLSGSGMAFRCDLYRRFLNSHAVKGAGFDKVLQAWIIRQNKRIAFNSSAIVYDEKTSRPEQLVNQRSRWINTWFKYFKYGFDILFLGLKRFNYNQILFGLVLLRPPLFIFLFLSFFCFLINITLGYHLSAFLWLLAGINFVLFFLIALIHSKADQRIYRSLKNIPNFIFYQILSLLKSGKANKISVSTQHYHVEKKNTE